MELLQLNVVKYEKVVETAGKLSDERELLQVQTILCLLL